MSEADTYTLHEWIVGQKPLRDMAFPYIVTMGDLSEHRSNNWRSIAKGTEQEMLALEKLMLAIINRELINEGETDENK